MTVAPTIYDEIFTPPVITELANQCATRSVDEVMADLADAVDRELQRREHVAELAPLEDEHWRQQQAEREARARAEHEEFLEWRKTQRQPIWQNVGPEPDAGRRG